VVLDDEVVCVESTETGAVALRFGDSLLVAGSPGRLGKRRLSQKA
jgi:hypothetical protein